MARIRSIKPEFWTSEQIAECSPNARLLFIGMWNFCDDYGVHPAKVGSLKMQVFPADDFTKSDISAMVQELIKNGLIVEYSVNGESYWFVTGWDKHQRPERKTGLWPRPDGKIGEKIRRTFGEHSANDQRKDEQKEKEKEKEKEKDINKKRKKEGNEFSEKNGNEAEKKTTPQVPPAPSPSEAAYEWAVQNLDFLRQAAEKAGFQGRVKDQVIKFCGHFSDYDAFNNQPVQFFKNKFAGWLVGAKEKSGSKRANQKPPAADQVTREKVLQHIKAAHGALGGEITERDISALIQCADMSAMRERCAEIVKSKMNDSNFSQTRSGDSTIAGIMGKIGQA